MIGRAISDLERNIIAMPVRYGGIGVANPVECCEREFTASKVISENLTDLIYNQETDLLNFDRKEQLVVIKAMKSAKETRNKEKLDHILMCAEKESKVLKRAIQINGEKGAGAWLTRLLYQ